MLHSENVLKRCEHIYYDLSYFLYASRVVSHHRNVYLKKIPRFARNFRGILSFRGILGFPESGAHVRAVTVT